MHKADHLAGDMSRQLNRRQSERQDYSVEGELTSGFQSFSCSVINLSNGGSKVEIAQMLERDELVELSVGEGKSIKGRVAWSQTPYYGLQFDEEGNDLADTLRAIEAYKAEGAVRSER